MKVYLTNPAGLKTGKAGPGKRWLITVAPPEWLLKVAGGICLAGCPPSARVMYAARSGRMSWEEYETRCRARWARGAERLRPEVLQGYEARGWVQHGHRREIARIWDGDTLLCVCSADAVCHRQWFAEELALAGWEVVLDGRPVTPKCDECPVGGREGRGPLCARFPTCNREAGEFVEAMAAERVEFFAELAAERGGR